MYQDNRHPLARLEANCSWKGWITDSRETWD